ncbi:BTAD domain-containing putative transcriptional regulator [Saccharopolyspora hattusasensis]|uniref:AfsR/SARP family transcriptional regulator n=1 Tax=Saccharopolyspora hattusasensis TaxID=1128679 RepID=UPI003D962925
MLGPVELLRSDGRTATIGAAKRRNVLAALAIDLNRVVSVDRLVDIAWNGNPPPTARASLQGHIAQLRKELGDGVKLVTRFPGYLLLAPRSLLDLTRFEDLIADARDASDDEAVDLLRAALALRRGPALADVEAEGLRRDASDRLDESVVTAVHELARRLNRLGRAVEAIDQLREAVAMRPLREPLVELLVLSLHQAGRQSEALEVFHDTRIRLADELGVAPGAGLQEAFRTLLGADDERPPARVPWQLPRENRGFVGRGAELAQLDAALNDDGPIRILTGPAGVGKTALALRWAHQVTADFEDGCLFVDLRGFDDADPVAPEQALSGFLRALGVPAARIPDDLDERAALYRSVLADRRLLVVLDNARSAAQIRPLLPGNSGCVVLVSSRSRLDDLVATEGAVRLSLPVLDREAAVAVLRLLLGAERVAAEPAAAAELAELCDRLPLALRIVATRGSSHPHFTIRSVVDSFSDERYRLTRLSLPDSGGSIRAALTTSYRLLDAASARLFRLLGEHPGAEVDYFAAAALAGTTLRDNQARLESLVAVNLLHVTGPGRYGRHDLVRLHSATLAAAEPAADRDAAITRLLDYYLHAAESGLRAVEGSARRSGQHAAHPLAELPDLPTAQAALSWFRAEEANIQHALALATARGRRGRACRLWLYLDRFRRHLGGPDPREPGETLVQAFFPRHIHGSSIA